VNRIAANETFSQRFIMNLRMMYFFLQSQRGDEKLM